VPVANALGAHAQAGFETTSASAHREIGANMKATMGTQLNRWTADELLAEVLQRSTGDRPALNDIQVTIMRALLEDCDRKAGANTGTQSGHSPTEEKALV